MKSVMITITYTPGVDEVVDAYVEEFYDNSGLFPDITVTVQTVEGEQE